MDSKANNPEGKAPKRMILLEGGEDKIRTMTEAKREIRSRPLSGKNLTILEEVFQ